MTATPEQVHQLHEQSIQFAIEILGDRARVESVIVETDAVTTNAEKIGLPTWTAGAVMTSGQIHEVTAHSFYAALVALAMLVREP